MAKTHIITKNGTKITIEGSPEEVATVLHIIEGKEESLEKIKQVNARSKKFSSKPRRTTLINLIRSLIDESFFQKPKSLSNIKTTLEERGHFYPITSFSPALLRLIRKRHLRRIKEKNRWLYVN